MTRTAVCFLAAVSKVRVQVAVSDSTFTCMVVIASHSAHTLRSSLAAARAGLQVMLLSGRGPGSLLKFSSK